MIARIWHGVVPTSKADQYLELMRSIALPEYLATRSFNGGSPVEFRRWLPIRGPIPSIRLQLVP